MGVKLLAVAASTLLVFAAGCGGSGSSSTPSSSTSSSMAASTTASTIAPTTSSTLIEITSPNWFSTPSGNISCAVRPEMARCDIVTRAWEPPPKPANCPLDWGPTLLVGAVGEGRFGCVSDSVYRPEVVVPYGRLVRNGPMSCAVEASGVTCRSETGHGFVLAAESYRTF